MANTQTETLEDYGYTPPEILDVVEAPDGKQCKMWTGEEPRPCTNPAENIIVIDRNANPKSTEKNRGNVLACSSCWNVPESDLGGTEEEL